MAEQLDRKHKLKNLFTSTVLVNPVMRASEVVRYSGIESSKPEDILQHTAQVSLMGYFLVLKLLEFGEDLDVGVFLEKSILHDIDETITGDIPRPTKYYSEGIYEGISDMATKSAKLLISKYSGVTDSDLQDRAYQSILNCKEGKEGAIVAVADLLGVAYKCYEEVVLRSNYKFVKVTYDLKVYLKELLDKLQGENAFLGDRFDHEASVSYLVELVQGAVSTTEYVLELDLAQDVLLTMDYNGHSLVSKFGSSDEED